MLVKSDRSCVQEGMRLFDWGIGTPYDSGEAQCRAGRHDLSVPVKSGLDKWDEIGYNLIR